MIKVARAVRWVLLGAIVLTIALELLNYIVNWAMGLILVPLVFAFLYFWQLASRTSTSGD